MARVLIVDDDPASVELLRVLLRHAGHEVRSASDGEDGLGLARSLRPELIVTDILMPGVDGFDLARRVRSDPHLAGTRVVFNTAHVIAPSLAAAARARRPA